MKRKKRTAKRRVAGSEEPTLQSISKSVLLALPITAVIGILLMLPVTAILLATKDPNAYHTVAGLVLLYLVTLLGGAVATRLHRRRTPLFCGLATACVMLLLLLMVSLILPSSQHSYGTALRVGQHALLFPAATAGALLGAKEPKKQRRRAR